MQFEKVPSSLKLAGLIGFLAAGPMTVFGFVLGGFTGGAVAIVILFFYFIILYMIAFRMSL